MNKTNLFLATFLLTGLVCGVFMWHQSWYFTGDDFGAIYAGKKGFEEGLSQFWSGYSNEETILPSNATKQIGFFSVMFRPLTLMLYSLNFALCKSIEAWPYFVLAILLHALCATLLFWCLTVFFHWPVAWSIAACWAIYPLMGHFIGRLSIQPYSIGFLLMLAWSYSLWHFKQTGKQKWLWLSAGINLLALLFNEFFLILPVIIGLVSWIWLTPRNWLRTTGINLLAWPAYLAIRFFCYPLLADASTIHTFLTMNLKVRFYFWLTVLTDTLFMTPIPEGNRSLKLSILILFLSLFLYALWRATYHQKTVLIGLGITFLCACWPALIFYHAHRYLYYSSAIFLIILALVLQIILPEKIKDYGPTAIFWALAMYGGIACQQAIKATVKQTALSEKIAKQTAKYALLHPTTTIWFVCMPQELCQIAGSAQSVWLYGAKNKVIFDPVLGVKTSANNSIYNQLLSTKEFDIKILAKHELSVTIKPNSTLSLCDAIATNPQHYASVCHVLEFSQNASGAVKSAHFKLFPAWQQNYVIAYWNPELEQMEFLQP